MSYRIALPVTREVVIEITPAGELRGAWLDVPSALRGEDAWRNRYLVAIPIVLTDVEQAEARRLLSDVVKLGVDDEAIARRAGPSQNRTKTQ